MMITPEDAFERGWKVLWSPIRGDSTPNITTPHVRMVALRKADKRTHDS